MAANVETMFYSGGERNVPWHGLGTMVEEAPTSEEAIKIAGLDWTVDRTPIFTATGAEIPNYFANMRSSDNSVLGVVGNRYQIVQNTEAFDFTDSLIGEDVHYETAGSLRNGKTIWLLAKLPEKNILGDKFEQYVCFTNNHDGFGSIKACMTPIRVVCNNTLNLALKQTQRCWSTKHVGDIANKLREAQITLQLANQYMDDLSASAEDLVKQKMSESDVKRAMDILFPLDEEASERSKNNVLDKREEVMVCMIAPDLANFKGTKWQFLNAIADYTTHTTGARKTDSYNESRWGSIIVGHPVLDMAYSIVNE